MRRLVLLAAAVCGCRFTADYGGTGFRCQDGVCPAGQRCVAEMCVEDTPPGDGAIDAPAPDAAQGTPDAAAADAPAPDAMVAAHPWCDSAFVHRRRLSVTDEAGGDLPAGFQVWWIADLEAIGNITDSYSSFHVYRTDCSELTRVIDDSAASDEAIWVRTAASIPAGGTDDDYWLYYDTLTATSPPSNPSDVFDYYDGFGSGTEVDPTEWLSNATVSITGGAAMLDYNESIVSVGDWGPRYAADFSLIAPSWTPRFWGGFQRDNDDFVDDQPWIIWISRSGGGAEIWPEFLATDTGMGTAWAGTHVAVDASKHIYNIDRFSDRVVYRWENYASTAQEFVPPMPYTAPLQFRFTNEGAATLELHMVRIRQTIYPLPTSSVGPEEAP